eukprot:435423_1
MSNNVWPFQFDDKKYNKPSIKDNKCTINDINIFQAIEECPALFQHIMNNKQSLDHLLVQYIDNKSEPFEPVIPVGTIGRVKLPSTEWQEPEQHRYVRLELIDCANYGLTLLPFHFEEFQYGFFFIDLKKSMQNDKIVLYFDRENEPKDDEEHIWGNYDMIEIIYSPQELHDEKDHQLGFKDMLIKFLKMQNNAKVDELNDLEHEIFSLLLGRLRGKIRNGQQGQIKSVQGIIQESLWDSSDEKLENIKETDDEYSQNPNITSYKLSRHELFTKMKINPMYLVKVYDTHGKEMKMIRNVRLCSLYTDTTSFTQAIKKMILKIAKKYSKSKRIPNSINCFNGLRINYNCSNRALIFRTNNYTSSITVDIEKEKVQISNISGRNGGW